MQGKREFKAVIERLIANEEEAETSAARCAETSNVWPFILESHSTEVGDLSTGAGSLRTVPLLFGAVRRWVRVFVAVRAIGV